MSRALTIIGLTALAIAAVSATGWSVKIGGQLNAVAAIPYPASNRTEQLLVSCGQCFGHSGYLAFGVVDAVQGTLLSSFSKCESNSTPWYANPSPICASHDGKFAFLTHVAGNGTQVALTSIANEPKCQGTFTQLPSDVAVVYNGPCVDGQMYLMSTVTACCDYTTYVSQLDVAKGTLSSITVPGVAGMDVYSLVPDALGSRNFLVIASSDNTAPITAYQYNFDEGLVNTYPLPGTSPGLGLALLVTPSVTFTILPAEPSPPLLIASSSTGAREILYNATLAAQGVNLAVPNPIFSENCGLVVVGQFAACYGAKAIVNRSGVPEWVTDAFEGAAVLSAIHPATGAIVVGVMGVGLVALNPFDGSTIWTESSPVSTNFTAAPSTIILVRGGSNVITSRYDATGAVNLVSTSLSKIPTPTAPPVTKAPPVTTAGPSNPPLEDQLRR